MIVKATVVEPAPEEVVTVRTTAPWIWTFVETAIASPEAEPRPAPSAIVVARGAGSSHDASALLRQLTARFGGKGGGRPELAQGGGLQGEPEDILAFAKNLVTLGR